MGKGRGRRAWCFGALIVAWLAPATAMAAEPPSFAAWLAAFRAEAGQAGLTEATLARTLHGLEPLPEVVEKDRRQPESKLTFRDYIGRIVSEQRVARGRALLREHEPLLARIAADYQVPPEVVVALWGIESNYGDRTGSYPVIAALATLAYEGRRAQLFRSELLHALRIVQEGHIEPARMTGSWAGAMGQNQFMPSSFTRLSVDYDGDGRRDIWQSLPDVLASIANYLAKAGWNGKHTWGREVNLRAAAAVAPVDGLKVKKSLPEWQNLGVRRADGHDLPPVALQASLVTTDDGAGPAYLVYDNFRVLMTWNRSTYFALTVGELADLIGNG